jgi:hypothetical protein
MIGLLLSEKGFGTGNSAGKVTLGSRHWRISKSRTCKSSCSGMINTIPGRLEAKKEPVALFTRRRLFVSSLSV